MVILRLKIDHFGGIKSKEIRFSDGLNVIYGANEAGKSTIAEFVRAMLYGMPNQARSNMIRENERVRYLPFHSHEMSGSMDVENDGRFYTIFCRFGKRKGEDKIRLCDTITGKEFDLEGLYPGEYLTNVKEQAFHKTNYIKQLFTKIKSDKDDEILKKLVNLTQTGDEKTSYKTARALIEEAVREINYRGRGTIPALNDQLAKLHREKAEVQSHAMRLNKEERELLALEEERKQLEEHKIDDSKLNQYREKYLEWQAERKHTASENQTRRVQAEQRKQELLKEQTQNIKRVKYSAGGAVITLIALLLTVVHPLFSVMLIPLVCAVWVLFASRSAIKQIRTEIEKLDAQPTKEVIDPDAEWLEWFEKNLGTGVFEDISVAIENYELKITAERERNVRELIEIAETIRDKKHLLMNQVFRPIDSIETDITSNMSEIKKQEDSLGEFSSIMEILDEVFQELQLNFGPKLNSAAARVLTRITNGRYVDIKVDENYNIIVIDQDNQEIKGDYLSSGAYDQIYFSLRMGIIDLLEESMPVIMDDAFALYDDVRHKSVMGYLEQREGQILLFTCHLRENTGNKITL